jgi:hypothetical protein
MSSRLSKCLPFLVLLDAHLLFNKVFPACEAVLHDTVPFGRLWYGEPNAISNAIGYSRSHHAVIRVFDGKGNVIETHEHAGDFKEW